MAHGEQLQTSNTWHSVDGSWLAGCWVAWVGAGWLKLGLAGAGPGAGWFGLGLAGSGAGPGAAWGVGSAAVTGCLQPSPAVSGCLRPSPAVSVLEDATLFPLKIVNCPFCQWSTGFESSSPFVNCQLDSSQVASKSDPLVFHWQSIGTWQLAA